MDDVEQKQKHFFVHIVHKVHIVHNDFRNLAMNPGFNDHLFFTLFYGIK